MSTSITSSTATTTAAWLKTAKSALSKVNAGVVSTLPTASNDPLGSTLMATIYDSKSITPNVLNAYWKRTGTGPEAVSTNSTSDKTSASSTTTNSASSSSAGSLLDLTA